MLDLEDYLELDKNKMCFGYLLLAKSSNPRRFDLKMFLRSHRTPWKELQFREMYSKPSPKVPWGTS